MFVVFVVIKSKSQHEPSHFPAVHENLGSIVKKKRYFVEPVVIDCLMQIVCAQWNHDGSILAIGGVQVTDDKESNLVQFFNPWGTVIKNCKEFITKIMFYNFSIYFEAFENSENSWHKN